MRKLVTGALTALTLGGAVLGAAAPASADPWHHGYYHHGVGPGVAVGAGLLGLAVGAAIADRPHYAYAAPPPPPPRYYYDGGCRTAWRWDPYAYRYVPVQYCY